MRPDHRNAVFHQIDAERERQDAKWGEQNHRPERWVCILVEEIGEVAKSVLENNAALHDGHYNLAERYTAQIREELIQVAAVAVAAIESIDRRKI